MGLFSQPEENNRRLKLYVYGAQGTGKTVTALHFPNPAVIDLDNGTDWYTSKFKFERLKTSDVDKVYQAVDDLIKDPGNFKTLVLDSFTKLNELVVEKHLRRLRIKKGNPQYTLQPADYSPIKSDLKIFINKLLALDLNVVGTAQVRNVYSSDPGDFMKVIDTQPDGPKDAPYLFDSVIELKMGANDTRIAKVIKDRTNKLPFEFEYSYETLVKHFGIKELEREPVKFRTEQNLNSAGNKRNVKIKLGNKEIMTAGVTAETLKKLLDATKGMTEQELASALQPDYNVTLLLDLREDEANLFLADLVKPKA